MSKLKSFKGVILVLIVLALAYGAYSWYESSKKPVDAQSASVAEAEQLVTELSQFMELPKETPGLATIVDQEKLANEPFFANAQNGDKLLVFLQAHKVILYRPSEHKVIESTTLYIPLTKAPAVSAPVATKAKR
jgi:hypothetical protein